MYQQGSPVTVRKMVQGRERAIGAPPALCQNPPGEIRARPEDGNARGTRGCASTIGDVLDLGVAEDGYALLTWVVVHSGDGPWSIEMQGSLDDSNWYPVGQDYSYDSTAGSEYTIMIGIVVSSTPARYLRISAATEAGGPTVSGWIARRLGH
jgi:hypothetical protein